MDPKKYGDDCPFYYSQSGCEKGTRCRYRHCEQARYCYKTCTYWSKGRCTRINCSFRHAVVSLRQKNRHEIPCYHENQPSGCTRSDCPFLHSRTTTRTPSPRTLSSMYAMGVEETSSDFSEPYSTGAPMAINCTSESIMLSWGASCEDDIVNYKIAWRECSRGNSAWKCILTENKKPIFTIKGLKSETEYEFKVCTVDEDGEEGPFSFPTVSFETKRSIAKDIKLFHSVKMYGKDPEVYKIEMERNMRSINYTSKTQKCSFGQKRFGVKGKTIMLVGATGSGKSTLLDGIINYMFRVSWEDDFRFTILELSDGERGRLYDQTQSQTEWITCYTIRSKEGSNVDYDLHIIDTPGFCDTRGVQKDKEIMDQIREFFTTRGPQGIMFLDAICFVAQAPLARLTPTQKYLFDAILSIFGQDVANNIFVLVTFADGKEPPVLGALNAANVPYKKHYTFNNSALFASASNEDKNKFGRLFWEMGRDNFRTFFEDLLSVDSKSLQLTKEVLQLRQSLETTIQGIQPQIHEGMNMLHTIEQEKEVLRRHEADILANRNFQYEVDEIRMRKIDLNPGTYVTNCLVCNRTCHFPCYIAEDSKKMKCYAMKDQFCTVCPRKCSWTNHRNNDFRFDTYSMKVTKSYDELKVKYQAARQERQSQISIIDSIKTSFKEVYSNVQTMMEDVRAYINKLDKIALRPNPLSDIDYIDLLIENEKNEKKYGWKERIKFFAKMREEAEIVKKAKFRCTSTLFENMRISK